MKKLALLLLGLFCLSACGGLNSAVKDGMIAPAFNEIMTNLEETENKTKFKRLW